MHKSHDRKRKYTLRKPQWALILLMIAVVLFGAFILIKAAVAPDRDSTAGAQGTDGAPVKTMPQLAEANYEQWLSAAMVVGLSMEYPDFELTGIYAASETALENKETSDGVYVFFTSGGESKVLYSIALEKERNESGTRDIYTNILGFASFDLVELESVDNSALKQILLDEIEELITQSMLVSIYTH